MIEWKISGQPIEYRQAHDFMCGRVDSIVSQRDKELIWFLEHHHVYTGGTSFDSNEVLQPSLPVVYSGRGGKLTYHGPGQLVVYIMLDLKQRCAKDVRQYIHNIEQVIIDVLQELGLRSFRFNNKTGVWVSDKGGYKKIAAIGVRIKKWVTSHGFSLNLNPDLTYYNSIIPCGIAGYGVTSLFELGCGVDKGLLIEKLQARLQNTFF